MSVRPSPEQSAMKIDSVPSAKRIAAPCSSSNGDEARRPESLFSQRRVPGERLVAADEDVRVAVAGEIDEPEIRVAPIDHWHRLERRQRLPSLGVRTLVEAGRRALEVDEIELAVAGEI